MKSKNQILKNVNVNELERTYDKCLVWFYAYPNTRIGLNELAKSIRSSKTATKEVVESLIRENFLHREIAGKSWILFADSKHGYILTRKMPYHLSKIYQSGVIEAIYKIIPQSRSIILFGSYRWGTDIETSDVDIAVETLDNKDLEIRPLGTIGELGYRKNVVVNMHIFSRNKMDLNLFANIANGIVLDGFLEVRP
ncbi:nucleotidyltransferase domain-containing protein [Candidatus Woesearchaeota archaeon]|nr:nucleotidyltransferase domain-containing protein [Candidatus Woesearchaeota archaeon]